MAMRAANVPRTGRVRRALRLWHRLFGLTAALWLALLGLTGSAIAFHDDLDRWLNPGLLSIATGATAEPDIDAALRQAATALPGFTARQIDLPNAAGATLSILGSADGEAGTTLAVQVFADPRCT